MHERLKLQYAAMSTAGLSDKLQEFVQERDGLKGKLRGNVENLERDDWLKVRIRLMSAELNSRQMRLEGF